MMYKEDENKSPSESRSHQFHFESNSFYNAEDRSIDLGPFFATYPELKPFFKDKFANYMQKDFKILILVMVKIFYDRFKT